MHGSIQWAVSATSSFTVLSTVSILLRPLNAFAFLFKLKQTIDFHTFYGKNSKNFPFSCGTPRRTCLTSSSCLQFTFFQILNGRYNLSWLCNNRKISYATLNVLVYCLLHSSADTHPTYTQNTTRTQCRIILIKKIPLEQLWPIWKHIALMANVYRISCVREEWESYEKGRKYCYISAARVSHVFLLLSPAIFYGNTIKTK